MSRPVEGELLRGLARARFGILLRCDKVAETPNALETLIKGAADAASTPIIIFDGAKFDQEQFLAHLLQRSPEPVLSRSDSSFQRICSILPSLPTGVAVIRDAQSLSRETAQLLFQLERFLKGLRLQWTFVLMIENERELPPHLSILGLDVVPGERRDKAKGTGALGKPAARAPSSRRYQAILGVCVLGLAAAAFFSGYFTANPFSLDHALTSNAKELSNPNDQAPALKKKNKQYLSAQLNSSSERTQKATLSNDSADDQRSYQRAEFDRELSLITLLNADGPGHAVPSAGASVVVKQPVSRLSLSKAMLEAIRNSGIAQIQHYVAKDAMLQRQSSSGASALHLAVKNSQWQAVSELIRLGADTNFADDAGYAPLFYAAMTGDLRCAKLLLFAGAKVDQSSKLHRTALMAAVHAKHPEMVQHLLGEGADPNLQDDSGWSALFYAARNEQKDLAVMLVNAGADLGLKNLDGLTPIDLSRAKNKQIL